MNLVLPTDPPIKVLPPNPKITVFFHGLVLAYIQDQEPYAQIGALRASECHRPKISITKFTKRTDGRADDPEPVEPDILPDAQHPDPDQDLELSVVNVYKPGIKTFTDVRAFDRLNDVGDLHDFRWFIDLEDVINKPLTINVAGLGPILSMNNALFYTETLTANRMTLKRGNQTQTEPFGRMAEHIAANIYFDQPESKAVFKQGGRELLTIDNSEADVRYEIVFDCDCLAEERPASQTSDFPLIYDVVGGGLSPAEKVDFEGLPPPLQPGEPGSPACDPITYCQGGGLSKPIRPPRP